MKRDPKELVIHFGGLRGRAVQRNYLDLQRMVETHSTLGESVAFPGLTMASHSYTFSTETGLLSTTQFAQPAICVVEIAAYEHLKATSGTPSVRTFAGHSLGEYAALACMTTVFPLEKLLRMVFLRGCIMHNAVKRDGAGRSEYGMIAVDPTRVHKGKMVSVTPARL